MPRLELPALYVDDVRGERAAGRLVLANRDPAPDEVGVPLDSAIGLEIIDVGSDGVDAAWSRVLVDGVLAYELRTVMPGWDGPRAAVVETADTLRIVLDPVVPLASEARVTVRVQAATRGGAHTLVATYSFTAEDRTAPRLLAVQAIAPKLVRLGFDEPVRVLDPLACTFERRTVPAVPIAAIAAEADGLIVLVRTDTRMTPDALYELRVRGVADLAGNPVLPPYDRAAFVGFRPARPSRRRLDLWSMLPKYNRREDTTGDLRRFIACLQEVTDLLLAEVDRFGDTFDMERAPEPFVDLILRDLGNPFPFELDLRAKRRLAGLLVDMYRQKGTAAGIRNAVRFFLGVHVTAIVPFAAETMVLGESELGVDWVLGPSERFARYAFDVHVDRVLSDVERRQLRAIVEYLRPAHTHFVDLLEPLPPEVIDHWLLGVSELGESSDLH